MKFVFAALRLNWRVMREHRLDLVAAVLSVLVSFTITLLVLRAVVHDFSNSEVQPFLVFFFAGILHLSYGVVEAITESFWDAGGLARSGELTQLLVLPQPLILQICLRQINYERLLHCAVGAYFIYLSIGFDVVDLHRLVLSGLICFATSATSFFSIIAMGAALSIKTLSNASTFMSAAGQISSLGLIPFQALRTGISIPILLLFPVTFSSMFGEKLVIEADVPKQLVLASFLSWLGLVVAAKVTWSKAVSQYQGTGT